jgi:hypothetical protein
LQNLETVVAGTTGILEGFVRDKATGAPLPGVNIVVVQTRQGAATSYEGYFRIHNLPAGAYEVRVSLLGYQATTFRNIAIRPDLATRLNVAMAAAAIALGAVEVRAEQPQIQRDVTGTIHQVEQEKIEKLPVDKFQEIVGLQAGTTAEGNIRGGKTREVSYLVDGLAVQNLVSGGLGIEVPRSAIQQLSIKTGGFDAEYGNALSGVVNVVTRSGGNAREYFFRADKDNLFRGKQTSKTDDVEFALAGPLRRDKLHYLVANSAYWTDTKTFVPTNSRIAGDYGFAEYVNNPQASTTGAELVITRDRGDWITGTLSYTLMKAEGLSEYENQGINYAQWGFPVVNRPFYLSWDQRHTLKADLLFALPLDLSANFVWQYHTGRPYTFYPSQDGFAPQDPDQRFLPNNERMTSKNLIDLNAAKDFYFSGNAVEKSKVTIYVDVRNLLNAKNVLWVDASGRIGGELGDPAAYYSPRRAAIGFRATF